MASKKRCGQKSVKAVWEEEVKLRGVGFVKQAGLSRQWKREGVMDKQSGKTKEKEMMGKGIGESKKEELVQKWGWQTDKGSWFQRHGEAYRKELGSSSVPFLFIHNYFATTYS